MFVYVLSCIFTYVHLFPLSVGGNEFEKRRVGEGGGNGLLQSDFLSNFMVAKGLFHFEYEMSVLWGILLSDDDD